MLVELSTAQRELKERESHLQFVWWQIKNGKLGEALGPEEPLTYRRNMPTFEELASDSLGISSRTKVLGELKRLAPMVAKMVYADPFTVCEPTKFTQMEEGLPIVFSYRLERDVSRTLDGVARQLLLLVERSDIYRLDDRHVFCYVEKPIKGEFVKGEEKARIVGFYPGDGLMLTRARAELSVENYLLPPSERE